ncbi:hypothetical protein D3C74_365040 [compost metagenome]
MEKDLAELNLIDLISEKHLGLRKIVSDLDDNQLNKTETHILSILEAHNYLSISQISRRIHLSRQGTHKSVQSLLLRELIATVNIKDNQRDRYLKITPKGLECNQQLLEIKMELEQRIQKKLGKEKLALIKTIFQENWLD